MWSRTAQASASGRSRVCLNPLNTVIRRSTTTVPKRKFSVADAFTACYTTILGSAALVDASYKDNRRKELDQKLESARDALQQTTAERDLLVARDEKRIESSAQGHGRRQTLEEMVRESAEYLDLAQSHRQPVNWNAIQAAVAEEEQAHWRAPGRIMDASRAGPALIPLREPKSDLQLARTVDTVKQLVDQLLYQIHKTPGSSSLDDAYDILVEVDQVRNGQVYPNYAMPTAEAYTHQARTMLSDSIRSIFAQDGGPASMVGKICFNLLTSSAPPSMHTYNALISGFNQIRRPDLAESVIDSYLGYTAWPATQQTIVCLLDHYRDSNDLGGFRDIVRRMTGYAEDGLHYRIIRRHPGFEITDTMRQNRQIWASRTHSFVRAADRGSQVFDSLIQGWLSFGRTGTAAMAFIASLRNGIIIPLETLHQLINSCLADFDSQSARKLIIGINNHFRHFLRVLESMNDHSTDLCLAFTQGLYRLLDFGSRRVSEMKGETGYAHRRHTRTVKLLISRIRIEVELHKITETVNAISKQFISQAVEFLAGTLEAREMRQLVLEGDIRAADKCLVRRLDLLALERRCTQLESRIGWVSARAMACFIESRSGLDLDPFSLITLNAPEDPVRQRGRLALRKALNNFRLDALPETENDVKMQLVRGIPNPRTAKTIETTINKGRWEDLDVDVLISFYRPKTFPGQQVAEAELGPKIRHQENRIIRKDEHIKATLFFSLDAHTQMSLRHSYPNWHEMPAEALYECHLQKKAVGFTPPLPVSADIATPRATPRAILRARRHEIYRDSILQEKPAYMPLVL